jgi:hypothetical protein
METGFLRDRRRRSAAVFRSDPSIGLRVGAGAVLGRRHLDVRHGPRNRDHGRVLATAYWQCAASRPVPRQARTDNFIGERTTVRAENLNPDVLVMQSANGHGHDASDPLNRARDRRITVQ